MKIKYLNFLFLLIIFYSCDVLEKILSDAVDKPLTEQEIANGLKEALRVGIDNGVNQLGQKDGYFGNFQIKIPLPPEALKVQNILEQVGLGHLAKQAIESINRAAEDAAYKAKPIFRDAITSMTIYDAKDILFGEKHAATNYLKGRTYSQLKNAFMPDIRNSLQKVNATRYWEDMMTAYNSIPLVDPVDTDLASYTTGKALDGLFFQVSKEEEKIRENPAARVNDILKRVFGELDK